MSKPIGLGLIGAGNFGAFCLQAYAQMSEVRVVAISDPDLGRARRVAPASATVAADHRALLDDPQVDLVAIAAPPYLHGPMAREAADAGKHVFVEKPLATGLADAVAAIDAARRAEVQLGINYVLRHHPLHRMVIEIARKGLLGEPLLWSLENFASAEALPAAHWFWDPTLSGGIHVEHGVHFFDLAWQLTGAPASHVSGTAHHRPDGRVDRVGAIVRYETGLSATFYHAFTRTARTERTTVRVAFARGHTTLRGWIPTELVVEGWADKEHRSHLEVLLGAGFQRHDEIRANAGDQDEGEPANIYARLEATDREREYTRAVQAGLRDMIRAVRGSGSMEVTAQDGLRSLDVALRATVSVGDR